MLDTGLNKYYPIRDFKSSYTRNAGHTIALSTPKAPIQNVVAVEMKYMAAPMNPSPYTAPLGVLLQQFFIIFIKIIYIFLNDIYITYIDATTAIDINRVRYV